MRETRAELEQLEACRRELAELLEQQTATSEVLSVISNLPGELGPVFQAMLSNATRLCEATFGTLFLREADGFRVAALHNVPPAYAEARRREPLVRPPPDSALGGVARTKQVTHIIDLSTVQSYIERDPFMVSSVDIAGYRSVVSVPMLKDNELIGAITISRTEVRCSVQYIRLAALGANMQCSKFVAYSITSSARREARVER